MTRYPTPSVLCLAGLSALLGLVPALAEDVTPPPSVAPSPVSAQLAELEARAPKDYNNPGATAAFNTEVISLVGSNQLGTGEEFFRAATLLGNNMGEFRFGRVYYELMLAAVAKNHPYAEGALHFSWDTLMHLLGRAARFDANGMAAGNPDFWQVDLAPECIRKVWTKPADARAALATAQDNPEIKTIVDADQAERKINWSTLTDEQRKAIGVRDHQRNARMIEIVNAGDLHTANDFSRASLVMQHSPGFAGFQLAHELAVCSLLLGDRQTGRWLVAATYDRMLHSLGHDQRFGTQYNGSGHARVDEEGICDAERQALGCPTLAAARNRQMNGSPGTAKLMQEIIGPDNTIHDTKNKVTATYPAGWRATGAFPAGEKATSVAFDIPGHAEASFGFYYRFISTAAPNGTEALLREQALAKEKDRQNRSPDYKNRPDSFVFRSVNGQPCLSWQASYTRDGKPWSEYLTRVLGTDCLALLFLNAPTAEIETLRPAVDKMAGTVQLP